MSQDIDYAEISANRDAIEREANEELAAERAERLTVMHEPRYLVQIVDPDGAELAEIFAATPFQLANEWVRENGIEALTVFYAGPNGLELVVMTEYYAGTDHDFRYYELYTATVAGADIDRIEWDAPMFHLHLR